MKKIFLLLLTLYFSNCVTAQINWTQTVAQPPFSARFACASFVINGKGYVIGGCDNVSYNPPYLTDVWEYDFAADKWTQKNPYPGGTIYHSTYFVIGNFAYMGMGLSTPGNCSTNFYKYDPSNDTWTSIASYPGAGRYDVVEFALNGEGYVGTGSSGGPPYLMDFYKYNPGTNKWSQIADFPGGQGRSGGSAFSYNGLGYAGFGQFNSTSGVFLTDFYAYDPATNKWSTKASLPSGKDDARFIEVCGKFYLVSGVNGSGNACSEVVEYDPVLDTWTSLPNAPFLPRWFSFAFTYNNVGYIGTGKTSSVVYNDFWKTSGGQSGILTSSRDSICRGSGLTSTLYLSGSSGNLQWLSSTNGNNYSIISGVTDSVYVTPPTLTQTSYYRVVAGGGSCNDTSNTVTVHILPVPLANFTFSISGKQVIFNSNGSSSDVRSYSWDFGDSTGSTLANPTHIFTRQDTFYVCLTVYNGSNCSYTLCQDVNLINTGINEINKNQSVQFYPNPASDFINLYSPGLQGKYQLKIYNVLGQEMKQQPLTVSQSQSIPINLTGFPQGTYELILVNDKEYYNSRFVVLK